MLSWGLGLDVGVLLCAPLITRSGISATALTALSVGDTRPLLLLRLLLSFPLLSSLVDFLYGMKAPRLPIDPTLACGVLGFGVNPGEGKGEELMPGLTVVVWTGWVGRPSESVAEVAAEPQRVSRVH